MKRSALRLVLLAILLVGFALRAWRLDFQELRGDEAFGYFFGLRPYDEIVTATIALQEPHPVASYFVQKAWLTVAGAHEYALRFISLWCGVLAAALLARLGSRLGLTSFASVLAAGLLASSPYAIWHSQDARMYSISLMLTIACAWLAVEWLQRPTTLAGLAYVAVSWLALHTHYFNGFVLLAVNLFIVSLLLATHRLGRPLIRWIVMQILLAIFYLPWLIAARGLISDYGGNGDSPNFLTMVWRAVGVFAVGESTPVEQRVWWAWFALVLVTVGAVRLAMQGTNGRRTAWFLTLYLSVPLLAMWISAWQRPIFNERYLVTAAPAFYLLVAAAHTSASGLHSAQRTGFVRSISRVGNGALVVLLIGMLLSLQRHYMDPLYSKTRGWRELATAISRFSAQWPPETVRIAQNFPDPTLWYYYRGPLEHVVLPPAPHDADGAEATVVQLADDGVQRIILPVQPAANWDEQTIAGSALANHYTLAATQPVGVWPVELYQLPPTALESMTAAFENGMRLTGVAIAPSSLTAGDYLIVHLVWQGALVQQSGTEKVFVQLLNQAGQLVAQDDRPLTLTSPALYAILLPQALPVGEYQLIAGLYDPALAGAPRIQTQTGEDRVVLRTVAAQPDLKDDRKP